jgi:hypothetical protein
MGAKSKPDADDEDEKYTDSDENIPDPFDEEDLPWNGESSEEERQRDLWLEENFGGPTTLAPAYHPSLLCRPHHHTSDTEISTMDITGSESSSESSSAMDTDENE